MSDSITLLDKLTDISYRYNTLYEGERKEQQILIQLNKELDEMKLNREDITAAWEALRLLLEKYASHSIGILQEMLQKGLDSIVTDRDYKIIIQEGDNQKKDLSFLLEEKVEGGVVLAPVSSSHGGGVLTILSFIYQIYLLQLYKKRPFLLADECFYGVSQQYLPAFMEFVRYLVDDLDFDILHITHDERIMAYFDKTYETSMGEIKLKER